MNYFAPTSFDTALEPAMVGALAPAVEAQRTLKSDITCTGIGVHSGTNVSMRIKPAAVDAGITFVRTDVKGVMREIPARWNHVVDTRMCTVIGNAAGVRVATIEHVMAAIYAYGITNAVIEVDAAEVPIMDGSSLDFVAMIEQTGLQVQDALRPTIQILSPVKVVDNGKFASLTPAQEPKFTVELDFDCIPAAYRRYELALTPASFHAEVSRARTFGFYEEVEALQKAGLARGGSLDNAVVFKDGRVMNKNGLRYADELARHKVLDAVGDIALSGVYILGHVHGFRTGHGLNNKLLREMHADPSAWRMIAGGQG